MFTASPQARSNAKSCGSSLPCTTYTCDFAWDIVLAILWLILLIASAALGDMDGPICAGIQLLLVITSSVLSGLARKEAVKAVVVHVDGSNQLVTVVPPTIVVAN